MSQPDQQDRCRDVLIPTYEESQSNYQRLQAYMYLNAEYEYDRLKNMDTATRSAQGTYKAFGAQYDESNTKEQFSEKVRDRLTKENYSLDEKQSASNLRIGLTDKQVEKWAECMVANGGGFMLAARDKTDIGFTLMVGRALPKGEGTKMVHLNVSGGTINNQSRLHLERHGSGSEPFMVHKNPGASAVTVSGDLNQAFADSLLLDYSPRKVDPAKPPFIKRYTPLAGGYVKYDAAQKMTVSSAQPPGPSENIRIEVDLTEGGEYAVDAMWTAAVPTEVWVYTTRNLPHCDDNMDAHSALYFRPQVLGGWDRPSLPNRPERVGTLLLPTGHSVITFTTRACGGGLGGGRIPSTEWIELTQLK